MEEKKTTDTATRTIHVEAPYFEDLKVGQLYTDAPAVTLTAGHAAFHEALFGDRMRLPLDATLCEKVTGSTRVLVHPNVICNVAIGQTTSPTQRVKGNLFYRGLILHQPVFVGDTIHVEFEITELRQTSKGNRAIVRTRNEVKNQRGETVLLYDPKRMMKGRD